MVKLVYRLAQLLRRTGFSFHEEQDPRVQVMKKMIKELGSIQFDIQVLNDGSWVAESVNIDGIITGGTKKDGINDAIKDAVFTYFEIPPQLCNDVLLRGSDEPMKLEQSVYA